jgi:hypothetical protein
MQVGELAVAIRAPAAALEDEHVRPGEMSRGKHIGGMVDPVRREVRGMITDLQGLNSVGAGRYRSFQCCGGRQERARKQDNHRPTANVHEDSLQMG